MLKRFIIIAYSEDVDNVSIKFCNAEDEEQAIKDFIISQDFDLEEDRNYLNELIDKQPLGVVEIDNSFEGEGYCPEIVWYYSLDDII